jgi:hypothetical protein
MQEHRSSSESGGQLDRRRARFERRVRASRKFKALCAAARHDLEHWMCSDGQLQPDLLPARRTFRPATLS